MYNVQGGFYKDYIKAVTAARQLMNTEDFIDKIYDFIDYDKLIRWAIIQGTFWDDFCSEVVKAEEAYINENVIEYEDNDDVEFLDDLM